MNAFESHHDNKSLCCCYLKFWRWKEGVRELNAADILFLAVLVSCKPTVDCSLQSHRKSFSFLNRKRNSRTKGAMIGTRAEAIPKVKWGTTSMFRSA